MISSIIRYFVGYVDFYATGADIESLFTFCAKNGIIMISHKKNGYVLEGKIFGAVR